MAEREINRDKASMNSHQFATMTRQEDDTIDLIALFYKLLDGWKWIVLAAVIGGLSFGAYTIYCIKPTYRATSTIYMLSNSDTVINMADLQIGSALTKDYVKVFDMWEVHEQVISKLNLPYSYNQMRRMLSVQNPTNTRMIEISITSTNPQEAADVANCYAQVIRDYTSENMAVDKPSIMSKALVPTYAIGPNRYKNIMIGILLGVLLVCGIITTSFLLDDKIKTADDITKYTGLVNLAAIPIEEEQKGGKKHA